MSGYRLSPQQRALWPLVEQDPDPYQSVVVIALEGTLDRDVLEAALGDLVRRHEILRTTFERPVGLTFPLQVIQEPASASVCLRASLADTPSGAELTLSLPALCADGRALGVLVEELADCYASRASGDVMQAEAYQYADLATWQNELLEAGDDEGLAFWRNLRVADRVNWSLPLESLCASVRFNVHEVTRVLDESQTVALRAAADRSCVSVADLLLTGWTLLVRGRAQRPDGVIGVLHDGRGYDELQRVPGLFAKYLPFDAETRPTEPVGLTARRFAERSAVQADWQEYFSWDHLTGDVGDVQGLARYAYGFSFELEYPPRTVAGVTFRVRHHATCHARFKLEARCREQDRTLELCLRYDTGFYEEAMVEQLVGGWVALLLALPANLDARAASLPLMGGAERYWQLEELNQTTAPYPNTMCMHELIGRQALDDPARVALLDDDGQVSYGQLWERSNALAWWLWDRGVRPDDRVALCARRGPQMIVGILGILKAGGAYVPLDPDYPQDRLAYVLSNAGVRVIVAQEAVVERLPPHEVHVITLDETRGRADAPDTRVHPDNLAYVIYTSGSTGNPKGVMVTHRNLVNSTHARTTAFEQPVSRFLLLASFAFDSSVAGIFWSLCQGGTLVLPRPGVENDPAEIVDHIARYQISHLTLLPSLYELILETAAPGQLDSLRMGYVGGEACTPQLVALHRRVLPDVPLFHAYGPTENTVWSTVARVGEVASDARVPIGGPIPNVRVSLLDDAQMLLPTGLAGEVCLGGIDVARGYLDSPGLTAERFIPDPDAREPGARLYRTGDLARRRIDGALEFVGRADTQVKVRGFRIELGEIEAAVLRHPAVADAVVLAREDSPGDRRLVAYVVPRRREETGGRRSYRLPNGLDVEHFDKLQTDALYQLIFQDETYLQHHVDLRPGDCVVDVGANIGLFSLYAWMRCPDIRLCAFEPAPPAFAKLRANLCGRVIDARLFNCALGGAEGRAELLFYPGMAGMSGLHADPNGDRSLARAVLNAHGSAVASVADTLLEGRFDAETYSCEVRPLSAVIAELGLERIDLLKIDAEKSEEDVLDGIANDDWSKIRQLVVEVHDIDGRLARMVARLETQGFRVAVGTQDDLRASGLVMLYARHPAREAKIAVSGSPITPPSAVVTTPRLDVSALRECLAGQLPAHMVPSVFVTLDALPLLPNGKTDRRALPEPATVRSGNEQAYAEPQTGPERALATIWAEVLGVERVGTDDNFFELGGDSILAVRVATRARACGLWVTPRHVFQYQTIGELAPAASAARSIEAEQGLVTGALPLTPVQRWFFSLKLEDPNLFNMVVSLDVEQPESEETWHRVVSALIEHHDALRLRFSSMDGVWSARLASAGGVSPLTSVDLSRLPVGEHVTAVERVVAEANRSIDLSSGPLLRIVLAFGSGPTARLVMVAHHLAIDVVSWQILIDDLRAACASVSAGTAIRFPPKTTAVNRWAERLVAVAHAPETLDELPFWEAQLPEGTGETPVDHADGCNTVASAREVRASLDAAATRDLLTETPRRYRAEVADILLTALGLAFARWSGAPVLYVDLEGHGRENVGDDIDVSRTVGWFTTVYPVRLQIPTDGGVGRTLMTVKEQLRRVPRHGLGFGLLRWLCDDPAVRTLRERPRPAVTFNYLGQLDAGLGAAETPFGFVRESDGDRAHLLELDVYVAGGLLQLVVTYSEHVHDQSTVSTLAWLFIEALREIGVHCRGIAGDVRDVESTSSFSWSREELEDIAVAIEELREEP